jgi:hypothetical protein
MVLHQLSLRERLIGAGLLEPADPEEKTNALEKCSVYLETVARTGIMLRSALDMQLTLAALERWYSL